MKLAFKVAVLLAASCGSLLGQTKSIASPNIFRVEGKISSAFDALPGGVDKNGVPIPLPRVKVTFRGRNIIRTVVVDDKGFYRAELPFGVYEMTVTGPKLGNQVLTPYSRLFSVKSAGTVVLDGVLYMAHMTCDVMVGGTSEQQSEQTKNLCGGEDTFPIPSKNAMQLKLYIRYSNRDTGGEVYRYGGDSHPERVPVFVAYNLFALEADKVFYDQKNSSIMAAGNVLIENGSGKSEHVDSIVVRLENGHAVTQLADSTAGETGTTGTCPRSTQD
jgi:hypothetical protein